MVCSVNEHVFKQFVVLRLALCFLDLVQSSFQNCFVHCLHSGACIYHHPLLALELME